MKCLLKEMQQWVQTYIKGFYTEDADIQENILRKEEHTDYVVRISKELAIALGLNEHDLLLAQMIGLFHDIGRFHQYTVYRTFNDRVSVNHALYGLDIIKDLSLLKKLDAVDLQVFTFAIANHNAIDIDASGSKREILFAKLIRDADKLDIYRVLEPLIPPDDGSAYSPVFVQSFLKGEQCDFAYMKTTADRKLVRLLWLYNINFAWTMQKLIERKYADEIIRHLPNNEITRQGVVVLKAYMAKKAKES